MNIKKIFSACLIAGIIGMNSLSLSALAISENSQATTVKEKKLTKKEKKAAQEKQNKLNYINIEWWESYNDEYLSDYIYKAVENNSDVKLATLKVEESRQAVKLQFSNELPQLTTGVSPLLFKGPNSTQSQGMLSIPILASYEADIFLKNHDKTKSAKKLYEASQYQEKATYIAIASQVGAIYYNIVKLDKLISIQENIINYRKEILDLNKLSNEEGIVSTADLVKSEKSYILATSDMIELKKAREIMLNSLCVLIGENPNNANELKRISYDEIANLKEIPEKISSEVITSRPDYMVAQKMIEKAGIDVRVAKKEFLPTIDILGLFGYTATNLGMSWETSLAGIGGAALLPIFTGGARIANFKINKNRYEQALVNYQKTNLAAIQEVNDSLSNLKLNNEKYLKNVKAYNMEQKDLGFTQDKYDEGIISKLDLLQKQETTLVTKKMVISSKAECLVSQISLYKAVAANL